MYSFTGKASVAIVSAAALLIVAGCWNFNAPDIDGALAKVPLPPGTEEFTINGDDFETDFYVSAEYTDRTADEILAFYKQYFDDNGWTDTFPSDVDADGLLSYSKGLADITVTTVTLPGTLHLMVMYDEAAQSPEDFARAVADSATPEAQALVEKVKATYAGLASYSDTGTYEWMADGEVDTRATFATAFVRPEQLAFMYVESPESFHATAHALGMLDGQVQIMADFDAGPETAEDLGMATAALFGVTSRTSGTIPDLLRAAGDDVLFFLTDLEILKAAAAGDGTACSRVQGVDASGETYTIWIGRDDYLIYRVESVKDKKNRETTIYVPVANAEVSEKDLEFKHPVVK